MPGASLLSDAFYAALATAGDEEDPAVVFARTYGAEPRHVFDDILRTILPVMRQGLKRDGVGPRATQARCSHFKATAVAEWLRIRSASSGSSGTA